MAFYTERTPGSHVSIDGKEYLFFSGFSYLGLHVHPVFTELLTHGIKQFGATFISSRIANVQLSIYEELEDALAQLLEQESSATFSSGYMASQAAAHYVSGKGQRLYAPGVHPSLQTGHYREHGLPWDEWITQTIAQVNTAPDRTYVIVADAVNPLTSTINDFSWLAKLEKQTTMLIDDSHGFGVLGTHGQGIISLLPSGPEYIITSSLAKAYSIAGGVVAGSKATIAAIKKQPYFTAGTPMMPANAWAWLQSRPLHQSQHTLLHTNIRKLQGLCATLPYVHNPQGLPIFILQNSAGLEQTLHAKDIIISSFGYPHPDSPPINRVIVSPLHTTADLTHLHNSLTETTL
jgi:8-amino-7-oxononanoate synthase